MCTGTSKVVLAGFNKAQNNSARKILQFVVARHDGIQEESSEVLLSAWSFSNGGGPNKSLASGMSANVRRITHKAACTGVAGGDDDESCGGGSAHDPVESSLLLLL